MYQKSLYVRGAERRDGLLTLEEVGRASSRGGTAYRSGFVSAVSSARAPKPFSLASSGAFASFGARSVIEPPVRLVGEARISIGSDVFIGAGSWLQTLDGPDRPGVLEIGDGTSIAGTCVLSAARSVRLGRKVLLARNVYISDHIHAYNDPRRAVLDQGLDRLESVEIQDGAWLGQNVVVCPGVTIGRGAVIGANSVSRGHPGSRCRRGRAGVGRSTLCRGRRGRPMRSVLILSYYFPPVGGAGAQRPAAFVRYLPRSGYQPIVVTGPGTAHSRWTPQDESLLAKLPEGTQVRRVPGPVPSDTGFVRERVGRYLGLRTAWDRWWIDGATTCAADLGSETDLVYLDVPVQLGGRGKPNRGKAPTTVDRRPGRPVGDRRDDGLPDASSPPPGNPADARRPPKRSSLVIDTQEAVFRVREAFPEFDDKPIVAIPNGFDSDDFAGAAPDRDPNVFRIVHTGYFHTELGLRQRNAAPMRRLLGGAVPGVDFLTRSHYFLLEAVDRLLQDDPSLTGHLELHFAGLLSEVDRELAAGSPATRLHGYVSHEKTLELLRTADLLFLPMQDLPVGVGQPHRCPARRTNISPRDVRSWPQCPTVTHGPVSLRPGPD